MVEEGGDFQVEFFFVEGWHGDPLRRRSFETAKLTGVGQKIKEEGKIVKSLNRRVVKSEGVRHRQGFWNSAINAASWERVSR